MAEEQGSATAEQNSKQGYIELGGNIELRGFSELDGSTMIVIKKIVGSYARKMSDTVNKFEKLILTMKKVHEREKSEKYELHAKMIANGNVTASEVTERNLFFAVDSALKKVMRDQS